MTSEIKNFIFPSTVKEAVRLLKKYRSGALLLAGGTRAVRSVAPGVNCIVDMRDLPLKHIKADAKWLRIGAMCTFAEMEKSALLKKWAGGIIASAAARGSSCLMRNMATVGGNLVRAYPFNNFPPVFLTLEAHVAIAGAGRVTIVPLPEIYGGAVGSSLGRSLMLTEVLIPAFTRDWKGSFEKLSKTETDWESYADAAAAVSVKGGKCMSARIAVGSITPRAVRIGAAEKILNGENVSAGLAQKAQEAVREALEGLPVVSSLKEYRKEAAAVLVKRCLLRAFGL
ncbi:MAG: FAD binding domain-containing protein [bacterium]